MIVSASRRTDIPAYYSEWFYNRIKEKYVLVRNPFNSRQVSRIDLSPDVVDGIVFWTKNPLPMLDKLDLLLDYTYYFQFTLTAYESDVERNIPSKSEVILPAFQRLSDKLGPDKVIWRYDPIFLSARYTINYHINCFEKIARKLEGYTKRCTISFIDYYRNTQSKMKNLGLVELSNESIEHLVKNLSECAHSHGFMIDTCAERINLEKYHVAHGRCVDDRLFEQLLGCSMNIEPDKFQRPDCGCMSSIDIGSYSTCRNGCLYCYANDSLSGGAKNAEKYEIFSPLLCGQVSQNEKITDRLVKSNINRQIDLLK